MKEKIYKEYLHDHSELTKKYYLHGKLEEYVQALMGLEKKYQGTCIEKDLYETIGHHLFLLHDMEQGMAYLKRSEIISEDVDKYKYFDEKEKEEARYRESLIIWFHKAQYYIEQEEIEQGKEYLRKCIARKNVNIYEEMEQWECKEEWEKYSQYIKNEIPEYPKEEEEEKKASLSIEEIFSIQDSWEFATAYGEYISSKCNYGAHIEALDEREKMVYYVYTLDCEVHSGGFENYFSSGSNYFPGTEILTEALKKIGAVHSLQLFEKARKKFPKGLLPKDSTERENIIEKKRLNFDKLDDKFYEYADHLDKLIFDFVHE